MFQVKIDSIWLTLRSLHGKIEQKCEQFSTLHAKNVMHTAHGREVLVCCCAAVRTEKLQAAKLVTEAGIPMYILNGQDPEILYTLLDGGHVGTLFTAPKKA